MQFWDKSQEILGAKAPLGLVRVSKWVTNKNDLGRISSGFMMFGGEKLEWEEEKYLQGAKKLWEAKKSECGTRQPI